MLDAMERAQDLAVGDPRADDPWIMIDRILDLLQLYLPDVRLHAQLSLVVAESEAVGKLLPQPDLAGMPFWLRHRRVGQSVWIPDVQELPRELQHRLDLEPADHLATAVVPIVSPLEDEGEVGLLYVTGQGTRSSDDLLGLAQRLSEFVSRRWRCQRDVNRRVLNDSLTGIPNRAFFDTQFPLELERVRRGDQPLTLVIADLDHFKEINDTYGHQCGDLVLRSVARQLLSALRRIDVVCRIGGEEFALILPSTSDVEAREVLGRIVGRPFRVALPPELGVGQVPVTISYGAVTFPEAGLSTGELHRKADGLLYEAKERGRNRCCLWTSRGTVELRRNDSVS
jgi:diguanylate cyclase (GGDEF)-like protein